MKNVMTYKDYAASVHYSAEDGLFVGRLSGIRHIIDFDGASVAELEGAFREAVDDYLQMCAQEGITPQRPYSGKLMLRLGPELHARIAFKAELNRQPINTWIKNILQKDVDLYNK
jgi:predicted HicB family RNase H-like nuclease